MADPTDAFSTLDDVLLSLADGISNAQDALTRAGSSGTPGRQYAYHLPRVEFELKMNLRVVEDATLSDRYRPLRLNRSNDKHLLFKPVAGGPSTSTLDVAAVVRGAFVAVPANGGLPPPVIRTSLTSDDRRAPTVEVSAVNAAGEPLAGLEVQFNLDRDESQALTAATGRSFTIARDSGFERALVTTDGKGIARSTLRIGVDQAECLLALTIDAAGRTETIVYEVRA